LPYFDQQTRYFVNFKKAFAVSLFALDLCAFNSDGQAKISLNGQAPDLLIPAWQDHFSHTQSHLRRLFDQLGELTPSETHLEKIGPLLAKVSNEQLFVPQLSSADRSLTYNFRR
jgi:hypothetical protein